MFLWDSRIFSESFPSIEWGPLCRTFTVSVLSLVRDRLSLWVWVTREDGYRTHDTKRDVPWGQTSFYFRRVKVLISDRKPLSGSGGRDEGRGRQWEKRKRMKVGLPRVFRRPGTDSYLLTVYLVRGLCLCLGVVVSVKGVWLIHVPRCSLDGCRARKAESGRCRDVP